MTTVAIIPARYASTRLPGKPLLDATGKPMVVHVIEQAMLAESIADVLVATDDQRIHDAVLAHGFRSVMTRDDHPNGTSRVAEAAESLPDDVDLIVNVQGDEPQIEPGVIDALVDRMRAGDEPMGTLASHFAHDENPADPNIVKLVTDRRGRAMYFSRSIIPFDRDGMGVQPLKHPGLYAYRRDFLPVYVALEPTPNEEAEKLEQLRALEHGHAIAVVLADVRHHGIDTPAQYEAFVAAYRAERSGDR
ncbi:MAG: 3-deoxy-manno-octulosonate cytidylyltransferase [Phycisphaera sp.]|nr:3-deoxy-manno-octulosonate cytidylyltransferase [Phycisphaera sp.]